MKAQIIKNMLLYTFLFGALFCGTSSASAKELQFRNGDSAAYRILQSLNLTVDFFGFRKDEQHVFSLDFEIKIISLNAKTHSYPFDVEIRCKKMNLATKPEMDADESVANEKLFNFLIDHPLQFRVEDEFKVEETTGNFALACETYEDSSFQGHLQSTFELVLTQIFQLSGKDLHPDHKYTTSCYQLINWDDLPVDENEVTLDQSSFCKINSFGSHNIKATWLGNAKIKEGSYSDSVTVRGKVLWNTARPLIQQRTLKAKLKGSNVEATLKQTISAAALE